VNLRVFLLATLVAVSFEIPSVAAEPAWLPSLAYVSAPQCPKNAGTRELRSAVVQSGMDKAFVTEVSRRDNGTCESTASLHLDHDAHDSSYPLPFAASRTFSIVDFAPDHSRLLMSAEQYRKYPDEQLRNVFLASVPLDTGMIAWRNAWDLFGWKDCDATVEPQGFTSDEKIVVRVRPSVMMPARRQSCVTHVSLYEVDLESGAAKLLPDSTKVERHGEVTHSPFQACASDPDLVGACFNIHGRLSYWNGAPSTRIGWIGTKRILGVPDEIVPESVAPHLKPDVDAYGDYRLCPLTLEKPHEMQMVCIESAHGVTYKPQ
jgi:hypothetical protein